MIKPKKMLLHCKLSTFFLAIFFNCLPSDTGPVYVCPGPGYTQRAVSFEAHL